MGQIVRRRECRTAPDIGCGTSSVLAQFRPRLRTVGLDAFEGVVVEARRRGQEDDYVLADVLNTSSEKILVFSVVRPGELVRTVEGDESLSVIHSAAAGVRGRSCPVATDTRASEPPSMHYRNPAGGVRSSCHPRPAVLPKRQVCPGQRSEAIGWTSCHRADEGHCWGAPRICAGYVDKVRCKAPLPASEVVRVRP